MDELPPGGMEAPSASGPAPGWPPGPPPGPAPGPAPGSAGGAGAARSRDPLAVALANASLLSAGYLMLRRRRTAALTGAGTLVLLTVLVAAARTVWCEGVVAAWWALMAAHGWALAGGRVRWAAVRRRQWADAVPRKGVGAAPGTGVGGVRRQRLVALAVALPVLPALGLLRLDASRIEGRVADARGSGDCARALSAQRGVWLGDRVADASLTARGDRTATACHRLAAAKQQLAIGLNGDTAALTAGFDGLGSVLADLPGHEKMVDTVLDGFLAAVPQKDPCRTAAVTDWLRGRRPTGDTLDRSAAVVARTAPAALTGCGDDLMAARNWQEARTRYQQVLDQYPGHRLTAEARDGVEHATSAIELADVRSLLAGSTGSQPEYCAKPAKYSDAPPYRKGTNRAMFFGDDTYTGKLPAGWRTTDAAKAVLVVCEGEEDYGPSVRTCPYDSKLLSGFPQEVSFRKVVIPVKAYELRTGKPVFHANVEIGGASCPAYLSYTSYGAVDLGPPSEVYVTPSHADVRAAFRRLITR